MHINPFKNRAGGEDALSRKRMDIDLLLDQPGDREIRPCPGCKEKCSCSKKSKTCCCNCSLHCINAHKYLSSEPDKYPIEKHVVPLVYGLTTLRVVETCWSCEGHEEEKAQPMKIPQVWFTAPSGTYAELIAQHLAALHTKKQLRYGWEIVINPYNPGGGGTTYVIRPAFSDISRTLILIDLQSDLLMIADGFPKKIHNLALNELRVLAGRKAA